MNLSELYYVLPEIWLVSMASLILIIDVFSPVQNRKVTFLLSQLSLVGVIVLILPHIGAASFDLLNHMFKVDDISRVLKVFIAFLGLFVLLYSRNYIFSEKIYRGEYFVLSLFSVFGMMVLVSAHHFLTLYLGIELLALPLYAMITMVKEEGVSTEASMKYFVMGALASGMMLYGISLLYGVTGKFELSAVANALVFEGSPSLAFILGLVFVFVGLAFKFGVVPFHMWLPDVYQGAPLPVTLFIGTLPELAGFGFAFRLLVDTFPTFKAYWQPLLIVMSILSLGIGNIVAIAQTNLKRMLAYSAIAHMGFVFLGLLVGTEAGYAAALAYILIYALMALGMFGIMTALSHQGFEAENIQDFRGLGARHPWIAFLLMMLLFSLTGIPPFAGFYAKFFVLNALIQAGLTWLAVVAVILTVVGAFYYLRIIRVMYFNLPLESVPYQKISKVKVGVLSLNGLLVLAVGMFPAPLFNLCLSAIPNIP